MVSQIDLGRGSFQAQRSHLSLTLHASAVINFPPETPHSTSFKDITELLRSEDIWIIQSPELKLNIEITPGSNLSRPALEFSSRIGQVLCNSKLWLDLGLAVLFKSCDHVVQPDQTTVFRLSFGLRRKTKHPATSKALRLPAAMRCYNDAVQPSDIQVAYLSMIDISLDYNYCADSSPRYTLRDSTIQKSLATPQYSISAIDSEIDRNDDILFEDTGHAIECWSELTNVDTSSDGMSTFEEQLEEQDPVPDHSPISSPDKDTVKWPHGYSSVGEFYRLFDAGFRNLIAQNPLPADKTIIQPDDEQLQCLSKIAPTVFSPSYREAVNQRAQFIPSITKSLNFMLERTNNPDLQHKKSVLQSSTPDVVDLRTTIKSALWRIAQKQLYNPKASRKIRPLGSTLIVYEEHPMQEGSLLADSIQGDTDDFAIFEDDDIQDYDSDYYLGSEGAHSEAWDEEIEENTLFSPTDDHSIGMLDDYESENGGRDTQETTLCAPEDTCLFPDYKIHQTDLSDHEMLASDASENGLSSPILFAMEMPHSNKGLCDDMLCDM